MMIDWVRDLSANPMIGAFRSNRTSLIGLVLFVVIALAAVLAPALAPHDPIIQNVTKRFQDPSTIHWLGTDSFGRDIFSRTLHGARISLWIGFVAILLAIIVGSFVGMLSGWLGGRFDIVVMQVMDVMLSFPSLILGLMIVAMLGPSMWNLILAIALTAIPPFARIARAPTISVKQRDYIEACRALGYSHSRILGFHILPNIFPDILVMASLWLATAIRVESSLAFIGLGVRPPTPTWGGMIREGFDNILDSPWLSIAPSIAILLVVFSLNMLGDGLRDAIDPKLKSEQG